MYDDIINDYLGEVTKEMGWKQRVEVARELRTHILDSADALAVEKKVPVDGVIVREVIAQMGPAEKIAAMYPTKKTILKHDMVKALLSLAGIAVAFLLVAGILELVAPDTLNMVIPGSHPAQEVLQVILSVVSALALAIVVIAAIFLAMYLYESKLKTPYEARLKALERSLHEAASPLRAAAKIIAIGFWLALINLFWARAPFIQSFSDNTGILVPLLSDKFGPFVPYFNAIGIAGIAIALLYLAIGQKWIPSLLEALLSLGTALLFIWLLAAFPFNGALSVGVATLIKVLLAAAVVGCLIAATKQIWQAIKFALHGSSEKSTV